MFRSIRWKVALGLALPILISFLGYTVLHYYREKSILLETIEQSAVQLGELARGGLRHAMLNNDRHMLQNELADIGSQKNILHVAIFDAGAQLRMTDKPADFDPAPTLSSPGCVECHQPTGILQRHSIILNTPDFKQPILRSSILVSNEPACHQCHDPSQKELGVIITDYSLQGLTEHLYGDMWIDLVFSIFLTIVFTGMLYGVAHFLIVKRVEMLRLPLTQYAHGDLSVRIPLHAMNDEIDDLVNAFNKTAESLEEELRLKELMNDARYRAVLEERHRLARELHDSTAQILGYVRNKATAVRMLIEQKKLPNAITELRQLDEAAGSVFADLRQAILDLKTDISEGQDIGLILTEYAINFERYSDIPTEVTNESTDRIHAPVGSDIQLLRIVQEALANVRKHAGATRATVILQVDEQKILTITIRDNGAGFDPAEDLSDRKPHFGLETMSERASSIGASFEIVSEKGQGTQVIVKLPLAGKGES
jgi:signal transduction histidine kinase